MSVAALGISSFELNDTKHVGGIACDESNLCFKKCLGEHQHPIPAKVSKSWWSKESLPKGLMLSLWRHGGLFFSKSLYGISQSSPHPQMCLCLFCWEEKKELEGRASPAIGFLLALLNVEVSYCPLPSGVRVGFVRSFLMFIIYREPKLNY